MHWKHHKTILSGGVIATGISPSSDHFLVVSHSGRGLYDLETCCRLVRDYEDWAGSDWYSEQQLTAEGVGDFSNIRFKISGIHSTSLESKSKSGDVRAWVQGDGYEWVLRCSSGGFTESLLNEEEELRSVCVSLDGSWIITATSSSIEVYKLTGE